MKITVIGAGRWGSLITWYLDTLHHDVTLYGPAETPHMQSFIKTRKNDLLELPESVNLCTNLEEALNSDVIIISINSQGLQGLFDEIKPFGVKKNLFYR